jgi:hypothetical protein
LTGSASWKNSRRNRSRSSGRRIVKGRSQESGVRSQNKDGKTEEGQKTEDRIGTEDGDGKSLKIENQKPLGSLFYLNLKIAVNNVTRNTIKVCWH